jgi:hypothetical protein
MIRGLFGIGTVYHSLRQGLNLDLETSRAISDRIANAANGDPVAAANGDLQAGTPPPEQAVNLEEEMVRLVDTTLRYDAETRLLREAYSRLRTAIGNRA